MEEIFLSKSREETQDFAEKFAGKMQAGGVILLYGNLGAGKTTFVQGLAKGLGIQKRIISPTFIIVRSYACHSGKRSASRIKEGSWTNQDDSVTFYHVDLYRVQSDKDIEGLGLLELIQNSNNIVVIEWPERLGKFKPQNAWEISFKTVGENEREIEAKKFTFKNSLKIDN